MNEQETESNWYAKRGDRVIGPIAFSKLQDLERTKRLRPDDQVRQSPDDGWQTASEVLAFAHQANSLVVEPLPLPTDLSQSATSSPERRKSATTNGLLPKTSPESPLQASGPPPIPMELPPTVREQARSGLVMLRESAKRIIQLTAKKAEATKIQQVLLPNAYAKLGKLVYDQTADANDGSKYPKITSLLTNLRVLKAASVQHPSDGSFTDKAKALSGEAVSVAKIKSVELQLRKEMIIVGKQAFLAGDHATDAEGMKVEQLQIRATEVNSEMSELKWYMPQQSGNMRKLVGSAARGIYSTAVVVASAVLYAPIGLFLLRRNPTWGKAKKSFWIGTSIVCFTFFVIIGQIQQLPNHFNIIDQHSDKPLVDKSVEQTDPILAVTPEDDLDKLLADTAVELTDPILAVTPEGDFENFFITDNSDYLIVNVREIWHIPSNKKLTLPSDTEEQVWIRTALSPDGRYMAAVVAFFNQNDVPTGTQLQIYALNKDTNPRLFKTIELQMPSSLPKDFDQQIARVFLNWTQIQWSEDCNTICLASRFAANIVRNWQETVDVHCIAHPEIQKYANRSKEFTEFIEDQNDVLAINSISCSPDGSRVAVCYEHGGIQMLSQITKESQFLEFPTCHTKWTFDVVSFTPNGKLAATVLQQESGRAEKQGVNVFYVSNEYVYIWDLSTMSVIAKVAPKDDLAPYKYSDTLFLGLLNDGKSMLTCSADPPTVFTVIDIATSKVVRQTAPISKDDGNANFRVVLNSNTSEIAAYQSNVLQVLSTENGRITQAITRPDLVEDGQSFSISNDDTVAIGYSSGEVKLFNKTKSVPLVANTLGTRVRLGDEVVEGKVGPGGEVVYLKYFGSKHFYEYFLDKRNEKIYHGICKRLIGYGDARGRCVSDEEYDAGTLISQTTRNAAGEIVETRERQDDGTYLWYDVEVISPDVLVRHRSIAKYTSGGEKSNTGKMQEIKKLKTVLSIDGRESDESPEYVEGFRNGLRRTLTHKSAVEQAKARGDGSHLNVMKQIQRHATKTIAYYEDIYTQQAAAGENADEMIGMSMGLIFGFASFGIYSN